MEYVAQKFDLHKDVRFSSDVTAAIYDEDRSCWSIELSSGLTYTTRILITALGVLSEPTFPNIEGIDTFQGEHFHTARWPKTQVQLEDKNVAVIGTGASGVQTIQEIAKTVRNLTVYQRRPN